MAKGSSNIVHQYFKKENEKGKVLLKINPIYLTGVEITIPSDGEAETNDIEVTGDFETALPKEGFQACNPFEFNLYWAGLA